MNFIKKHYTALQPYKEHLTRGFYGHYVYGLRRKDFEAMQKVYKELGYERNLDYNCSTCLLQLTQTLGKLYFEYEKKMQEKVKKEATAE